MCVIMTFANLLLQYCRTLEMERPKKNKRDLSNSLYIIQKIPGIDLLIFF